MRPIYLEPVLNRWMSPQLFFTSSIEEACKPQSETGLPKYWCWLNTWRLCTYIAGLAFLFRFDFVSLIYHNAGEPSSGDIHCFREPYLVLLTADVFMHFIGLRRGIMGLDTNLNLVPDKVHTYGMGGHVPPGGYNSACYRLPHSRVADKRTSDSPFPEQTCPSLVI